VMPRCAWKSSKRRVRKNASRKINNVQRSPTTDNARAIEQVQSPMSRQRMVHSKTELSIHSKLELSIATTATSGHLRECGDPSDTRTRCNDMMDSGLLGNDGRRCLLQRPSVQSPLSVIEGAISMQRFADRVAIVTGAASGLGHATALRLASEGATIACLDVAQ